MLSKLDSSQSTKGYIFTVGVAGDYPTLNADKQLVRVASPSSLSEQLAREASPPLPQDHLSVKNCFLKFRYILVVLESGSSYMITSFDKSSVYLSMTASTKATPSISFEQESYSFCQHTFIKFVLCQHEMYILNKLPKYGWRRTGAINVLLIFTCTVILLVCLMINVFLQPTRSIKQARVIFQGDCNLASRIDIVLHLLLNIFSTCILASSNFFMQILSAPSRRELDVAHRLLLALEIGVPSIKNIFFLSPLKTVFWMGLFLSSMPIHLLLNSAVFETIYEGSDWNLTLATEAFLNGTGQYFGPGASLATSSGGFGGYFYNGDGEVVPMADYWTNTSWANMSIQQTATEAFGWEKITLEECFREYRFCNPRKQHRDLVVVIDAEGQGWNRSDVFHLDSLTSNQAQALKTLDEHVPPDVKNSLWVSGKCTSVRTYIDENNCGNDGCASALGETSGLYWTNTTELLGSTWTINFSAPAAYGLNRSSNDLNVAYCRTEANPDYQCKVGASNALLLVVILCALTKVILCTLVLWRLPQTSLVTLGDAMESYISKPDRRTFGLGTINIADSSRIENSKCTSWTSAGDLREGPRPRKWRSGPRIFKSVISKELWLRTYSLLSAGVLLLAAGLYFLSRFNPGSITYVSPIIHPRLGSFMPNFNSNINSSGSFGPSDSNISIEIFGMGPSYIVLLLAANCPQLILSTCYFSFNAFFTRLQTEYEWNSYSLSYKPLRVSNPSGQQVSTYRLQLPYRYSIPLLGISILLHWILSNTVFLYVVEGGESAVQKQILKL